MSIALRDPPDLAAGEGGTVARRAVVRWAVRLFRREWRQQLLVLGLLTVAVAATAMASRPSTSSCWRHSRRNSRQPQRITARRATMPLPASASRSGRSDRAVLTGSHRA